MLRSLPLAAAGLAGLAAAPFAALFAALSTAGCGGSSPTAGAPPGQAVAVAIQWDAFGVAHIESSSDAGAYFGAGYAAARDRLLQMHLARLGYRGRLAQYLGTGPGDEFLHRDRAARLMGWVRHAEQVAERLETEAPELFGLLVAYAAGVNRWIDQVQADPALAFHPWFAGLEGVLAPLPVEPWTVADAIASWNQFGWNFAGFNPEEIELRAEADALAQSGVPPEQWAELLLDAVVCDDAAAVVQPEDVAPELLAEMEAFAQAHGVDHVAGCRGAHGAGPSFSQASALVGAASADGRALLAGDPRAGVRAPGMLYEWHMRGATFDARGAGVAGSPNLVVGSNPHVAWSATALGADLSDLFLMTVDRSQTPWTYLLDGQWLPMDEADEPLLVWTGVGSQTEPSPADADLRWRHTHFGPLITALVPAAGEHEVALRAVPLDRPGVDSSAAFLGMIRAGDVPTFRQALAALDFPSTNLVFAGRADAADPAAGDRVGYVAAGAHPLRAALPLAGLMAQDGDQSANDWQADVPHHLKPWAIRDGVGDSGVLFSANHSPIGAWYPLPRIFPAPGHGDRSRRLAELLGTDPLAAPISLDLAGLRAVHLDAVRPSARDIVKLVRFHVLAGDLTLSGAAADAFAVLGPWLEAGARLDGSSPGAALASFLPVRLKGDNPLHEPLIGQHGAGEAGLQLFLLAQLVKLELDPVPPPSPAVAAFLEQSLAEALELVSGPDAAASAEPAAWDAWYLAAELLEQLPRWKVLGGADLEQGSVPHGPLIASDITTLHAQAGQMYTQLVPVGVLDGARSMLVPGQSEHFGGPHGLDQLALWELGLLKPSPTSPAGIAELGLSGEPVELIWQGD